VRIDAAQPWADEFRRALRFWNTVLAANFHEERTLRACAVRIVDGGPAILNRMTIARSQLTGRDKPMLFYINVDGDQILDGNDMSDLSIVTSYARASRKQVRCRSD
jgi:hypothetical protein